MRWRLAHETIEEHDHTLHRPSCPKIRDPQPTIHDPGTVLERAVAPRECWTCLPEVEMALSL